MSQAPRIEDFPSRTFDKLRYGDTDRQGHINNAVYGTFYETGRVGILYSDTLKLLQPGASFVLARITIDFLAETFWPGEVTIGTGVRAIGRSSITFAQALFQGEKCVSVAESVLVQVDGESGRSAPLSESARGSLELLRIQGRAPET
jgi:acyl-CoA thioester hydrolase